MSKVPLSLLTLALSLVTCSAAEVAVFPKAPGTYTIRFSEAAVQAEAEEVKLRLHAAEEIKPFDIAKEQFQLVIPKNYRADEPWGLFLWVSPSGNANLPADWLAVLAARKLLFVGGLQAGNPRDIFDRIRMAIDANVEMRHRYRIDGRRVYVSGFSGGARVASMLGVAFADLFTGAIPFMGVNFYTQLPGPGGTPLAIGYIPDDDVLAIAKEKCRYALVTAENDFNRVETHSAEENGFRKEGFKSVISLEAPGIGHAMPPALWLERGLEFLDTGKAPAEKK